MGAEIQAVSPDLLPNLDGWEGTDAGVEIEALRRGEPWLDTTVAGLQFYDYAGIDELTGEPLIPAAGDRLSLVREPENPHDPNAVEVWWRNGIRLGTCPASSRPRWPDRSMPASRSGRTWRTAGTARPGPPGPCSSGPRWRRSTAGTSAGCRSPRSRRGSGRSIPA